MVRYNIGIMAIPRRPRIALLLIVPLVIVIGLILFMRSDNKNVPQVTSVEAEEKTTQQQTLSDPTDVSVVVNKLRPLPAGYVPADLVAPNVALRLAKTEPEMQLRKEAATALEQMFADAKAQGVTLVLTSGYRSETEQKQVYGYYVEQKGQAAADTDSARPGYSEHQTGLAVDVGRSDKKCQTEACFGDTPEGKWVIANAAKHGFVLRYLRDKDAVTGYTYEPWHLRYMGKDLAGQISATGKTVEEFFGLPAAPTYK